MNPALRDILEESTTAAFSPSSIAGLALWLDASDASTFTLDGSDNAEAWNDKSGTAKNMVQAATNSRPKRLQVGGYWAAQFDGIDDFMEFSGGIGSLNITLYIACRIATVDGSSDSPVTFGTIANDFFRYFSVGNGFSAGGVGGAWGWRSPNQDSQTTTPKTANNVVLAFTVGRSGTTVTATLFVNNTQDSQRAVTNATGPLYDAGVISLGRSINTGTTWIYSNVNIFEVLAYGSVHDATTRGTVNTYLSTKWGV